MDWNIVEKNIEEEITFLNKNIQVSPFHQNDAIKCQDCLYRLISILVVSGKIKLRKVNYLNDIIWNKENIIIKDGGHKNHGSNWHSSKIKMIKQYFLSNNYDVKDEPPVFFGRADLGITELNIFIEVGTINIYKLYFGLL